MEKQTLNVPNISCGHCVQSIQNELSELAGVASVQGDAESKTITVSWDSPATLDQIRQTLERINYPAQ